MLLAVPIDIPTLSHSELVTLSAVFSEDDGTCLLYSGGTLEDSNRSFLCLYPKEKLWIHQHTLYHQPPETSKPVISHNVNPWDALRCYLPKVNTDLTEIPEWVGYFGYGLSSFSDQDKRTPYRPSPYPDAYFLRHSALFCLDHSTGLSTFFIRQEFYSYLCPLQKERLESLTYPEGILTLLEQGRLIQLSNRHIEVNLVKSFDPKENYYNKIETAKELIRSGEIYQVNLSQQLFGEGYYYPYTIFQKLCQLNPAPFMGYFRLPNFSIVCSSPERFLCKKGDVLETRPIKGTMPRGKTPEQDFINKEALLASSKERAELLMITDLMRNDLGKISVAGSVVTEKIWHCQSLTNVFHLYSVIKSTPKPHLHPIDLIRSAFPGGSISGCPKLRAIEVIDALEERARGIYTGSMGYIAENGDFDLNIAIRTVICQKESLDVQLGGGIVIDSDPEREYHELIHKGASIFKILGLGESFNFIDTY